MRERDVPRCPITYDDIPAGKYSDPGLRRLSRRLIGLQDLPFTAGELRREALARATKMSIQGLQPKLSAVLNVPEQRFDIVDLGGQYILKPPIPDYPEVPENEDVTMRMAEAAGVEVPMHGMIYTADGALCYFIRRFDRVGQAGKRAVEDFAQLLGYTRETKYDSSLEQVIGVINRYCTFPVVERLKLFRRVLFAFLCGNEDMHLKNFSVIVRDNKVELSPAYDLVNTTIVLANPQEEMALPLAGKKSNIKRDTLLEYFARDRLELTQRAIDSVLGDVRTARPQWADLLDRSFLREDLRMAYEEVLVERWNRLGL
jgi:serine/threonine-protein kinase HipA